MQLNFRINDAPQRHQCVVRRDGDWIIFTCPQCEGYERRLHLFDGKTTVQEGEDPFALHEGVFIPQDLKAELGGGFSPPN